MSNSNVYQPLPFMSGRYHTRIFHLSPGTGEDPLKGTLQVIDNTHSETYEVLSLASETASPTSYLFLQGGAVPIGQDLEAALLSLRKAKETRALWLHAICINQEDSEERTRQAKYRKYILHRASQLIAWIGAKTPGLELAFDLVHRLADLQHTEQGRTFTSQIILTDEGRLTLRQSISDASSREHLFHFRELLRRPYFTTCWSLEDVMGAKAVILKSEDLEIDFEVIGPSFIALSNAYDNPGVNSPLKVWSRLRNLRECHPGLGNGIVRIATMGEIVQLLDMTRSFHADDVRDRIFAIRELSTEGCNPASAIASGEPPQTFGRRILRTLRKPFTRESILLASEDGEVHVPALMPNYHKSAAETYMDLARFMMLRPPGNLDILNYVVHNSDPDDDVYPSWVPKWHEPSDCAVMQGYFRAGIIRNKYPAAQIHDNPTRGGGPKQPFILSADGFLVDGVDAVSDPLEYDSDEQSANVAVIERAWTQLFGSSIGSLAGLYRDNSPLEIAFCQAVSAYPFGDSIRTGGLDGMDVLTADRAAWMVNGTIDKLRRSRAFVDHVEEIRRGGSSIIGFSNPLIAQDAARFLEGAVAYGNSRRVFKTKDGSLGIGPKVMQPGDKVIVLFGARLPFVVRRKEDGYYRLIGQCYVVDSALMDGGVANGAYSESQPPVAIFRFR